MSKAARQRSARERLAEERQHEARRRQRTRAMLIGLGALAIVALIVVVVGLAATGGKSGDGGYGGALAPVSRRSDGAIVMAKPGVSAPKLEVFEDFQCPICNEFEKASGNTIKRLAAEGKVSVVYTPFWLFREQAEPLRGNSQRAANAALCAPPNKWVQYHDTIYRNQPEEGTNGFSNADLIGWAKDLGFATPAFRKCVTGLQKQGQLNQISDYAEQTRKITGTPTVFLNGKSLSAGDVLLRPKALEKAVLNARPAAPISPSAASQR
jgi:protein-disulfide isomerase